MTASFGPSEGIGSYVPPNIIIPEDWVEARLILTDYLLKAAEAINAREIAQYQDATLDASNDNISETVTGQAWFVAGDPNRFRYGSRTVVNITAGLQDYSGALTTQQVRHGIATTENTRFTRIYGVATDPGASTTTQAIPIPYLDVDGLASGIELWVDATYVNLRYQADYSAFTSAYVVLEYVENT